MDKILLGKLVLLEHFAPKPQLFFNTSLMKNCFLQLYPPFKRPLTGTPQQWPHTVAPHSDPLYRPPYIGPEILRRVSSQSRSNSSKCHNRSVLSSRSISKYTHASYTEASNTEASYRDASWYRCIVHGGIVHVGIVHRGIVVQMHRLNSFLKDPARWVNNSCLS